MANKRDPETMISPNATSWPNCGEPTGSKTDISVSSPEPASITKNDVFNAYMDLVLVTMNVRGQRVIF